MSGHACDALVVVRFHFGFMVDGDGMPLLVGQDQTHWRTQQCLSTLGAGARCPDCVGAASWQNVQTRMLVVLSVTILFLFRGQVKVQFGDKFVEGI